MRLIFITASFAALAGCAQLGPHVDRCEQILTEDGRWVYAAPGCPQIGGGKSIALRVAAPDSQPDKPDPKPEPDKPKDPKPDHPKPEPDHKPKPKDPKKDKKPKSDNSDSNGKGGNKHDREDKPQGPKGESHE